VNRIDRRFKELKSRRKSAFIAYITAGDPSLGKTRRLVLELEKAGADIIELGIPFSDPLADGPTIQAASQRALAGGVTLKKVFRAVQELRLVTQVPIVFMTYYNPILRYGSKEFFASCRASGVDGVIVPDLPFEESSELVKAGGAAGVATIFLVAPTSTPQRISQIAKRSQGFIYYVSLTGVTGVRAALPSDIARNLKRIKSITKKPVAVGFGVSSPAQASALARHADGVIVGSAIVKMVGQKTAITKISRFVRSLSRAIHNV
jgi:tryptophan synthase alpha chain